MAMKDRPVSPVRRVHVVLPDVMDHPARRVCLAQLVPEVLLEMMAKMDNRVSRDHQVLRDPREMVSVMMRPLLLLSLAMVR